VFFVFVVVVLKAGGVDLFGWTVGYLFSCMITADLLIIVVYISQEARQNKDEFSSSFFRGTFDGFWWAFISMTTVG
jgi:uncharacterized membrane protein